MRITVTIPDEIAREAKLLAAQLGKPVSAIYTEAIEMHVKALRRTQAIEAINSIIGQGGVAPDADEQLKRMRRASDRDLG